LAKIDKIKLVNFKSFKRAAIPIASGYTTIVGPNGSGKSNICDGICFVLGTSALKSLRAERLIDLIHHGIKESAVEVTIDLYDGKDTHSVSRSIDKTGTSVFRLDGRRTTKYQVEEMLGSLNIKPDGHNIIQQGEVTRIVKMSPMQRRTIIDEVSGISEYEEKKQEAMKELGKVEEKLKEATIVLGEKQGYLSILEKEKVEAERYIQLKDQAKKYRASIVKRELDGIEKEYTKALDGIAKAKVKLEELEKQRLELVDKQDKAQRKLDEINKELFQESEKKQLGIQKELDEVKASIANAEARINSLRENIQRNTAKKEQMLGRVSELSNQMKQKQHELELISPEEDDLSQQLAAKQKEFAGLAGKGDKGLSDAYKSLDEINAQLEKEKDRLYRLEGDTKAALERFNLKKSSFNTAVSEAHKQKAQENEIKTKIRDLTHAASEASRELGKLEKQQEEFYSQEKDDNARLERLQNELLHKKQSLSELSAHISTMRGLTGLTPAVEAVIKNKSLKGICGTVSDLCKYSTDNASAIEASAGPRLFYIVTETADDATEAVKWLKGNKLGRATFIPLDKIRSAAPSKDAQEAAKQKGAVGLALDLVSFSKKYQPALQYVFGDTVVVKDIDHARTIGIGKCRMATLDGDLCESSGAISGGWTKKGVSMAQIKQADELKLEIESLESDREAVIAHLTHLRRDINDNSDKRTESEVRIKENETMAKAWEQRLAELEKAAKQKETWVSSAERETKELEVEIEEKNVEKDKIIRAISALVDKRSKLREIFERPEAKEFDEKHKTLQSAIQELGDRRSGLKVKRESLLAEIEKVLGANLKEFERQVHEISTENKDFEKQVDSINTERVGLIRVLKEKEIRQREIASSNHELMAKQGDANKELGQISEAVGQMDRRGDRIKEDMHEKELIRANFETRYHDLKHEWEKLKNTELASGSVEDLKTWLANVENQLNAMGAVNLKAIEMCVQFKKDIAEIEEKSKKLKDERGSIHSMMEEIEKKKIAAFMDAFVALNKYFDQYFRDFYPEKGSAAGLRLQDPEKPLESGLLIEAKPAGRPLRTIDSMSGGEKSITALAFLFAVQAYNPSPFYILDEVDAALDKENSERLARMLKKISKQLQFIIITHNPSVTRESDQIIGVHMGKDGSSVVEVDLKKYQTPVAEIVKT
jgi:chromosome segregation protein